jgi:RHS repeat-associated protein
MSNNSQESSAPSLYALQFSAGSVGAQGINLFRGNLAFPLKLISLPSLNNLALDISIMYQSNVEYEVDKWNLDAPTDILGLGWSLPFEKIILDPKSNGSPFNNQYYLVQGGQTEALIPIPQAWVRATIPASAIQLKSGQVDAPLQETLAKHHIKVHASAILKKDPLKAAWLLQDDHHERHFLLSYNQSGDCQVESGGISFELSNFKFWQISYYPDYEKWEIIKEDGSTFAYGGSGQAIQVGQNPNVLQYGIQWGNWIGNSTQATNQTQYVRAWNLATVNNLLGNYHIYNYQVIEQTVGDGTLSYTKECHVQAVQNDLGWSCAYSYKPMVYDNTSLDAPKEYMDPHKDPTLVPDTTPDAYQSQYTTQCLDKLTVYNASQEMQLYLQFDYYTSNYNGTDYELINLTQKGQNLLAYGGTFKRYLKSVTPYYSSGISQPGVTFYYNLSTDQSTNRGAMNKILYPSGGMDIFSYESVSVGGDAGQDPGARNLTISNPFGNTQDAARVWYGADYVVCAWYDEGSDQLKLNIFTWIGRWYPAVDEWFTFNGSFDIDHIQIGIEKDIFLLALPILSSSTTDVYLFNRQHLCNASWEIQEQGNTPVKTTYQTTQFQVCTGDAFFIFQDMENQLLHRYAWNWMQQSWDIDALEDKNQLCQSSTDSYQYYVGAYSNYYIVLCYDLTQQISKLTLYYKDALLNWYQGGSLNTSDIQIVGYNSFSYFNFGLSDSFAGLAYITGYTSGSGSFSAFDYEVKILTWDENFDNLAFAAINGVDDNNFTNITTPILTAIGPVAINNTLIASGPNFFLYDGNTWQAHNIGIKYNGGFSDLSTQYYWYAYAEDAILKTENTISGIYSQLTYTDTNNPDFGWKQSVLQNDDSPPTNRQLVGYPTLIGSYLTQDTDIYNKSVYADWDDLKNYLLTQVQGNIDTTTIINQAPYFIAFMTVDDDQQPLNTHVLFFRNGDLIRDDTGNPVVEVLDNQQMTRLLNAEYRYQSSLNGKLPAIPQGFITFPNDATLDQTDQITLHRYSDESIQGVISAFVINSVTTDDGYQQINKCFAYSDISAAQDATGTIVRFHQVQEYVGVLDPKDQQNGYTTSYFYNGLPPVVEGFTDLVDHEQALCCYSMLDGTLILKGQYDVNNTLVSQSTYMWTVATQVSTDAAGQNLRNLYGGLPQVMTTIEMQDGVSKTTDITYSPASGNQISTQTSYYNSMGECITKQNVYTYAYEQYSEMWQLNILDQVAQVQVLTKSASDSAYSVQSINVQTYQKWRTQYGDYWATFENYVANSTTAPAFTWWEGGTVSDEWNKMSSITARDSKANVLSLLDNQGMITTNIYDDKQQLLIATFKNAVDVSYDSFETYQAPTWTVSNGTAGQVISTDSFTGQACFNIASSGSLTKPITLTQPTQQYVLSCFIKTPLGADSTQLTISLGLTLAGTTSSLSKNIAPTNGEWQYCQWVIDMSELGTLAPNTAILLAINTTLANADLYLRVDDIVFTPLQSIFGANVYNVEKNYRVASLTTNGNVSRNFYNLYDAPVGAIGSAGNVKALSTNFLTRQTTDLTAGASFPQSMPNTGIGVVGQDQGFYDEFKADALANYQFINSASSDWQVSHNQLSLVNASSSPLGAQVVRNNFTANSLAIYVLVDSQASNVVSIGTGSFFVSWNGSVWQLGQMTSGQSQVLQQETTIGFQQEWLLVVFDNRLLFYANGIVIFNYQSDDLVAAHQVMLGLKNPGAFYNLMVAENVSFSLSFSDGTGKTLQAIAMESGDSVIMNTTLYDDLGRPAITVKPARITSAQVTNPFGYYLNYVTNSGPTGSIWTDAPATGPVVDTYHPNDGGYPFSRHVYEASPLARTIKQGQPGLDFAITKDSSGKENPHISTSSYGNNQDQGPFLYPLPVGNYYVQTQTDPDGNYLINYKDVLGNDVGSITQSPDQTKSTWFSQVHDKFGYRTAVIPPVYYQNPPQQTGTISIPAIATTASYDFLGRLVSTQAPDRGISTCIYDQASRPRFSQDARGAAQGYINYIKYDMLGRTVEQGYYVSAWDPELLQDKANTDPTWPPVTDTWITTNVYDGDDTTPNMLGRIWYSLANNQGSLQGDVKDTFTYDQSGKVLTKSTALTGTTTRSCTLSYTYNSSGSVLTMTDDNTQLTTLYEYNPLGQLINLSSTTDQVTTQLASFTYTQEGAIANYGLLPDNNTPVLERSYTYNSPGWLDVQEDASFSESLQYTQGSCDNSGYYGGTIASQAIAYTEGQPSTQSSCYTVDYCNQIIAAGTQSWAIDGNGNFSSHTVNGTARTYTLVPGNNQLQSITTDDQSFSRNYQYNEIGHISQMQGNAISALSFTYYDGSNKLKNIDIAANSAVDQLLFGYGPDNSRVYKAASLAGNIQSQQAYFNGVGGGVEIYEGGTLQEVKRYIPLPGVVIIYYNDTHYFALKDHLNSTRVIIDQQANVVGQFSYDTYGTTTIIQQPSFQYNMLYTGHEYEAEVGLYNYKARHYDPQIGRFIMPDPAAQFPSPYTYAANNPIIYLDPDGALSVGWMIGAGIVGAIATIAAGIATGGLAVAFLAPGLAMSVAVGATAGVVGALAQNLVLGIGAAINHEKFSVKQLGVDVLAGLVGGALGSAAGGVVGRGVMSGAMKLGASRGMIVVAGSVSSGGAGGLVGSFSGAGINSAFTGQSLFTKGNALSFLISGLAGLGGGLLASGAYLGYDSDTLPIQMDADGPMTAPDGNSVISNRRYITFSPKDGDEAQLSVFARDNIYQANGVEVDVVVIHGAPRRVFPEVNYNGQQYNRYMTPKDFATVLQRRGFGQQPNAANAARPIKLISCHGASMGRFSVAQQLANALRVDVYASPNAIRISDNIAWTPFTPQ